MMMSTVKQESSEGYENQFYPHHHDGSNSSSQFSTSMYFNPEFSGSQIKIEDEDEEELSFPSNGRSQTPVKEPKEPKKRGRPKKAKDESTGSPDAETPKKPEKKAKQDTPTEGKKRRDRFNGMPEEEVVLRLLPDHLAPNLDIVIVGINPGLLAAYVGHHYVGPSNHFWKCLHLSGLTPEPMTAYDDFKLIELGIGFTNICARTTKGSADLKKSEIKEGGDILRKKIQEFRPKIAVFNGKGIFEVFSGNKNFNLGRQPEKVEGSDTLLYVMPSSSARCAQLPRAMDKVPYYVGLKKLRDHLKGDLETLEDSDVVFPNVAPDYRTKTEKVEVKEEVKVEELDETSRSTPPTSGPTTMTLDQIQQQTEYQEALAASAEGMELIWRRNHGTGDLTLSSSFTPLESSFQEAQQLFGQSRNAASKTSDDPEEVHIKQECYFGGEYESVAVNGPTAERVNLEAITDPYQCHIASMPQYVSLGDLPSKSRNNKNSFNFKNQYQMGMPPSSVMHHSNGGHNINNKSSTILHQSIMSQSQQSHSFARASQHNPQPHPHSHPMSHPHPMSRMSQPHPMARIPQPMYPQNHVPHPHSHPQPHPNSHPQPHPNSHPQPHPNSHPQPHPHSHPQTHPHPHPTGRGYVGMSQ